MAEESPAIGIDLGTTYSCVAVFLNNTVKVIPNEQGNNTTPSWVSFSDEGHLVGEPARNRQYFKPENTIYDVKRLIGKEFADPKVQNDIKSWPFKVVKNDDEKPMVEVKFDGDNHLYHPEEISALVLLKMKKIAETYLKQTITKAVVTVPAYFNENQRHATITAAKMAGLEVLRIINEPTAAAIAYDLSKKTHRKKEILIFDLGGGTFDVSILTVDDGILCVKATTGDTHLGGADFDKCLADYIFNKFSRTNPMAAKDKKTTFRRMIRACEVTKCMLSTKTETILKIESFHDGADFEERVSRDTLDRLNDQLYNQTLDTVREALHDAKMSVGDVDDVILIGGSTRIPKIRQMLSELFKGKALNKSINPDEAVACGAAVQAAILNGDQSTGLEDILLMDVTPLSLGVHTKGNIMSIIIPRNTLIPASQTKIYETVVDNQTAMDILVFQGERPLADDNFFLGKFTLDGIRKAPSGVPKIEKTFELDVDGMLCVHAVDKDTGNKQSITIDHSKIRCSDSEVRKIIAEAETHKVEDEMECRRIEARNKLLAYANWVRYLVSNHAKELRIANSKVDTLQSMTNNIIMWLTEHAEARVEAYIDRLKTLKKACSCIPDECQIPGHLPTGKRTKDYMMSCADVTTFYNDDENYDVVGEID